MMQTLQLVGSAVVALHAAPQNTCTGHMEPAAATAAATTAENTG